MACALSVLKRRDFSGAQVDAPDESGATALHVAARFGHLLLIKKLIQNNANVSRFVIRSLFLSQFISTCEFFSSPGPRGLTPLHIAAQLGYLDPVRALTEAGANLSLVDDDGRTPLHLAAYSTNPRWLIFPRLCLLPIGTITESLPKAKQASTLCIIMQ